MKAFISLVSLSCFGAVSARQQILGAGDTGPGAVAPAQTVKSAVAAAKSSSGTNGAVVTASFCRRVLADVVTRQAPYFVDGKFTGECRKDLIDQCGERICSWAQTYKELASACPSCPKQCGDNGAEFMRVVFPSSIGAPTGNMALLVAVQKEMAQHAAPKPAEVAPVATGVTTVAPAVQEVRTDVTKGFCKQMLQDISEGKAPYFVEGKFTGESRTNLIQQCSQHICGWALKIKEMGAPKCGDSECCMPSSCDSGAALVYLHELQANGQTLRIIKLIHKAPEDPSVVPSSIPAAKDCDKSPCGNLRGAVVAAPAAPVPTANDPRDPDFQKHESKEETKDSKDTKDEKAKTSSEIKAKESKEAKDTVSSPAKEDKIEKAQATQKN